MDFEYLGPYRVEKVLGRGGMGTVFLGTHANSGDSVAMKVIASALADQERFRRRFAAEVETLKRLKHVNIVQLIGYGEEQGHLFYSMEYVAGHSLADTIRKTGRIPSDRAIEIAIEVCAALKHAHDFGIIHRDLKPANVMLTSTGQVKLTDFGIAKLFGSADVTAAGSVLGTADYMPPEQAEGKPVTVRSDLYALGSMLFAMLSGRSPHAAKSVPEVLYNVRYSVPASLDTIVPDVPIELAELVTQLLAKEATDRPPTALVVGNRLRSLQQGLKHRRLTNIDGLSIEFDDESVSNSVDGALKSGRDEPHTMQSNPQAPTEIASSDRPLSARQDKAESPKVEFANAKTQVASSAGSQVSDSIDDSVAPGKTRFTVIEEEDRRRASLSGEAAEEASPVSHWMSVTALLLLIAASFGGIFYFTRSPSADQLYQSISTAVESGSDDNLIDVEPTIEQFETLYPNDSRISELASIKSEIEEKRTIRRLMRHSKVVGSEAEMDPVEQAFLDCMRAQQQNTDLARRKIRAFLIVFSRPELLTSRQQKLVDIATSISKKMEAESELKVNPAAALLQEQIDWAKLNLSGEKQKNFCRSLMELYGEKAWASPAMNQVRILMADEQK